MKHNQNVSIGLATVRLYQFQFELATLSHTHKHTDTQWPEKTKIEKLFLWNINQCMCVSIIGHILRARCSLESAVTPSEQWT